MVTVGTCAYQVTPTLLFMGLVFLNFWIVLYPHIHHSLDFANHYLSEKAGFWDSKGNVSGKANNSIRTIVYFSCLS